MGKIFLGISELEHLKPLQINKLSIFEQLTRICEGVINELGKRGCQSFLIPSNMGIEWLNHRAMMGDIALMLSANHLENSKLRGTQTVHIAHNRERKKHGELLLLLLLHHLPHLVNLGSGEDTTTPMGYSLFCRQVMIPSLEISLGCISNPLDREILLCQEDQLIQGLADGLIAWSREVAGIEPNQSILLDNILPIYPSIDIRWHNRTYREKGILKDGNPYIPIDLVERLGINLYQLDEVNLVDYQGVVYLKVVELQSYHIGIEWDCLSRTLILDSRILFHPDQLESIMGIGKTSEIKMMMFLKGENEQALIDFSQIAKLYREEANIEGVNADIAFCQMCLETNFLHFGGQIQPSSNNFARLSNGNNIATFTEPRLGVRSHIQHLKAYASLEPLVQECIDPCFERVVRAIAPKVSLMSGRWSADRTYGAKIIAILRRLYDIDRSNSFK